MNRRKLTALLYVGLSLALCLAGVQMVVAAGLRDGVSPSAVVGGSERVARTQPDPGANPGTPGAQAVVQLVEAFEDRFVLAVSAGEATITEVKLPDGGACQEISLAGYQSLAEPGHAALPAAGAALGIPTSADPTIRVVDAESVQLPGVYSICPEPAPILDSDINGESVTQVTGWQRDPNPDFYGIDILMPIDPVEIASTGFIRDQRVAQLVARPVQYNPVSGEIHLFTQITVEIRLNAEPMYSTAPPIASHAAADQPFDALLRSYLLNYDQALAWRKPASQAATEDTMANAVLEGAADSRPVYRVKLREAGLYTLTFAELQAADPSVNLATVDPQTFHLSTQGQEVAIEVTGQSDGVFGPDDTIYFYAEAINTVYANTNVYWLTWDETPGLRMVEVDATPTGGATVPAYYTTTMRLEEDRAYRRAFVTADGDNWFWNDLRDTGTPAKVVYPFQIPNLASGPLTATLSGDLLGYGTVTSHSVEISINGHRVHTGTWPSLTQHLFEVSFPHDYLTTGTNALSVTIGIGNGNDYVMVNRFALTYAALYAATNDQLRFDGDHAGTWEFRISGFTTDTVKILDITEPVTPTRIIGQPTGGPSFALSFEQSLAGEHQYLASTIARARPPVAVARDVVSDLHNPANATDYIVIAHGSLITAAHTLADYRTTQGLRAQVVDVQDIYDEFNFGIPDPSAIRDFLAFAYANWTAPAPAYVVLFGDGNYDPKDNLGRGEPSLIPPYLAPVDPWIRETAADNRYVKIDGDDLPDMFLGRLPANTLEQANALVDKIITYELTSTPEAWQTRLLFVADNSDAAGYFNEDSDAVADYYVPTPYVVDKVYLGVTHPITAPVQARTTIITAINEGRLIVNYSGHGNTQVWAEEKLLSMDSMGYLNNADRLPFFVPMTCLEGYFIIPSAPGVNSAAIAETLVRLPTGGAIASWSATGLGLAHGHDYLNRGLYEAIFFKDIIELGPATAYAKQFLVAATGSWYTDLLETYTLFGDPALRLNVLPADLQVTKTVAGGQTGFTSGDTITYALTYTNAGPATAHRVVISDTLPTALTSPTWTSSGTPITPQLGSAYIWDVGDLPAGAGGVITVTGVIPYVFEGTLTNSVEISTTAREIETGNNRSQVVVRAAQHTTDAKITDLAVIGGTPSSRFQPGDPIAFTLTYFNIGSEIAHSVVLTNTLPELITDAVWVSSGAAVVPRAHSQFVWDVADLTPDAWGAITITGFISRSLYAGPLTNVATISTGLLDIRETDNTASVTVTISPHRIYLPLTLSGAP